jgi:hypothetical protein
MEKTMSEKTHTQDFTVDGVPTVLVGNIRGSVTVSPGPEGQVTIRAVERGSDDRTQVEIGQDADGTIYARTRYEQTMGILSGLAGKPNKVEYTVTVPANTNLTVKGVSSETDVRGVSGEVRLKSVSGKVRAADLSGNLHLETVSGKIKAEGLSGPTEVRTVSGNVSLIGSDLPSLLANSVSGSLELETPIGAGPYELKTVSGTVRIRSAQAPGGRVHFKSISGSAWVNGSRLRSAENDSRPGPKSAVYDISGDGPDIRFSSVSGSLKLVSDDYVLPEEPVDVEESREPEAEQPAMMDLLERISSGELSVDEAVKELGG